ncbi:Aste57867_8982 [Aphanomyces stellatus]|uniref:Aste57867_8982 protein n=1 Tax=Aphanomyces stellatus TaxID=120398 RepID=A0A485KLU1_9STRA|nr:hypothetical protein As57867_008947 [Aphanomyces stellatus]VFT85866.1 Aste57867_8982 [Aphanomyces stellatus]
MGRYIVKKVLAKALYGQVLLCQDTHTTDLVAVKRIHLGAASARTVADSSTAIAEDFAFEKAVHGALSSGGGHRHVLQLHDTFVQDGYDHLVLTYCARGDLFERVNGRGGLELDVARRYFRQIAAAVGFMHSRGVAHRDLSLENVLLDAQNNCHVCDFGLAAKTMTLRHETVGKPFYMAPEVLATGQLYDPAQADVWSLGVMLFMMITGAPLCETASSQDARFQFVQAHGLRTLVHGWGMSQRFDCAALDLLEKMLHPNPKARATMTDVLLHPFVGVRLPPVASSSLTHVLPSEVGQQKTKTAATSFLQRWKMFRASQPQKFAVKVATC